jgi:hypothetical protein
MTAPSNYTEIPMKASHKTKTLGLAAAVLAAFSAFVFAATPADDVKAINDIIRNYAKSVSDLDIPLAEKFWQTDERVSFIHPRGNEYGWSQIKDNFYGKTMGETFSSRELQIKDVNVQVYGDTAVAVFHWDFPAVFRKDGSPVTTHGRESQVFTRTPDGWKLVHIHYSNMPVTGDKQGF